MIINYRTHLIVAISCLLIGRYVIQPKAKVEVKEVIKYVENTQEKEKKRTTTKVKETTKKDGSVVKDTVIVEDSSRDTSTEIKLDKTSEKKTTTGSGITLGILAVQDFGGNLAEKPKVGILYAVPLFGSLSVAGTFDSGKRVGVGLAVEF